MKNEKLKLRISRATGVREQWPLDLCHMHE